MKEYLGYNIHAEWHGDTFTLQFGTEKGAATITMTPNVWMEVNRFVSGHCIPQGFGTPTVTDEIARLEALRAAIPGEPCGGTSDTCTNPGHLRYWDLTTQINTLLGHKSHLR